MPNYTIKSTKIDKTNFNNNQPHNYTSNNNSSNIITKIEENNNNNNIENNIETLDINNEYSENNLLSTYINNLQKYGFTETDINRVLNGEIELETLYNEIQKDNDNTRRTLLMESQYLQNSCNTMNQIYAAEGKQLNLNYNNIKELEEDIKNIKNILKTKNEEEALLLREELELKNYIYNTTINEVSYWMKNIDPYIIEEDYAEKSQFDPNALEIINKVKKEWDKQISEDPEAIPNINLSNEDLTSMLYCIMNNKAKESDSLGIYTDNLIYNNYLKWKDFLKEEELTTFNYIYNKKGAKEAYNYLANLSHTLDKRYIQDKQSKDAKHATSSIFNSYMASKASVFLGVPEAWKTLFSSAKAMIDKNIHGKEEQELYLTNTYSTSDTYRSAVAQRIAAYNDKLSFLYSTGMSMADTGLYLAMNIATGGTMSLPLSIGLMGSRAYSSTLNDMLGRGISDEVAVGIAAGSAAIESLMEAWSAGHIFKLEGHLSDSVIKGGKELAKRIDNPVIIKAYQILAEAACQSICEGEEEVSTELCNMLLEEVSLFLTKQSNKGSILTSINEYESKGYNEIDAICKTIGDFGKQIGFSFLGGAISGASFGSVKAISDVNQTDKALQQGKYGNLNGNKAEQLAQAFEINKKEINLMQDTYKRLNSLGLIKENTNIDIKQIQDLLINKIINEEEALIMIKGTALTPKADLITPTELKQMQELINTKELSEYQAQIAYIYSKLYNYDLPLAADIAKIVDEEKIDRSRALELLEKLKGPNPKEIEEIYKNNPVYFDEHPMKFSSNINIETNNNLDAILEEVKKRITKEETLNNETIVGDTIEGLNSNNIQDNNITQLSKQEIELFIDEYLKDPTITIPKGISNELVEYLEKYLHNPDATCPTSIPIEIINYIQSHANINPSFFTIGGDLPNSNNIQTNNITQLSKQEIELFIDEYLKDPTITIPKGISNELVEYLEKYLHDPDATCPTSIPIEIINYIQSHANVNPSFFTIGGDLPNSNNIQNNNITQLSKQETELFKVDDLIKMIDTKIAELEDMQSKINIDKEYYKSNEELMEDVKQILMAHYLRSDINLSIANMGETGKMYEFTLDGKTYLVKPGVNKGSGKVRPARAEVQEAASRLQKIISPNGYVKVNTYGSGNVKIAVQEKIPNAKSYSGKIEGHIDELLHEYVTDYLLANFDSAACNFIIDSNGKLIGIDKEQSFKYLLSDDYEQSLNLNFNYFPAGSMINIYPSFLQYIENNGLSNELSPILEDIKLSLSNISDEEYMNIFRKYATARDANNTDVILERILERKNYFLDHIDEFMFSIKIKNNNEVNFSELFNGKLGTYGDAVTIVSNGKVLTKYNFETDGNQTRNISNILSEITGKSINENELINGTKKVTDYGAIITYNSSLDSLFVGIELPQTITTELIEGLEKLDEQWKKVTIEEGKTPKIFVNNKYISRIIDPNEEGVNIHEFDKIIKVLKDRKSLIDQREELQDKFYSMVPLNRKVEDFAKLDSELQQEVSKKAAELQKQAITNEISITSDIESLTDINARTINLDKKIKSLSSLQEKIAKRVKLEKINQEIINQKVSINSLVENSISDITDTLRYTLVVDEKNYTDIVLDKLLELTKKGYQIDRVGNSWGDDYYQGLNMTLISPNGQYFELQFHTEDSFMVKEKINHVYYEQSRDSTLSENARKIAQEIQRINQELYVESTDFIYKKAKDVKKAIKAYEISKTLLGGSEFAPVSELFPEHEIISYQDYKNLTLEDLKKWNKTLEISTYVDPVTKKTFSYKDLIKGYISEALNLPGSFKVLNLINRALDDSREKTIQNLINGKHPNDEGFYELTLGHKEVGLYDSQTELIYLPGSKKQQGLNVDGSIGTIDDLITRVKSETKALLNCFMRSKKNMILRRGTGMGPLRAYGIKDNDSALTIYKKLTTTEDGIFLPTYLDSSFMSASPDLGFSKKVIFMMAVNKETPLGNFALESNKYEHELLVPLKTKFDIIGVKKDLYGRIYIYLKQQ